MVSQPYASTDTKFKGVYTSPISYIAIRKEKPSNGLCEAYRVLVSHPHGLCSPPSARFKLAHMQLTGTFILTKSRDHQLTIQVARSARTHQNSHRYSH